MSRRARSALARIALVILGVLCAGSGLGNPGCDDGEDYVEPRAANFEEYACRINQNMYGDRDEVLLSGDAAAPTAIEPSDTRRYVIFDEDHREGDLELVLGRAGQVAVIMVQDGADQPFTLSRDGEPLASSATASPPSCEGTTIHYFEATEGSYDLHIGPTEAIAADFVIQHPDAY